MFVYLYWVSPLIHLINMVHSEEHMKLPNTESGNWCVKSIVNSDWQKGLRQRSLPSPGTCLVLLEMSGMELGNFCRHSRWSTTKKSGGPLNPWIRTLRALLYQLLHFFSSPPPQSIILMDLNDRDGKDWWAIQLSSQENWEIVCTQHERATSMGS